MASGPIIIDDDGQPNHLRIRDIRFPGANYRLGGLTDQGVLYQTLPLSVDPSFEIRDTDGKLLYGPVNGPLSFTVNGSMNSSTITGVFSTDLRLAVSPTKMDRAGFDYTMANSGQVQSIYVGADKKADRGVVIFWV